MRDQAVPRPSPLDDYRPIIAITVWVRWILLATFIAMNNYRIDTGATWLTINLLAFSLLGLNIYMTVKVLQQRPLTWYHAFILSAADMTVITVSLYLHLAFMNDFYAFYYPALLAFSLMFPGRPSFAMVSLVAGLYILMAFTISPTLEYDLKGEKVLLVRVVTMIGMVMGGTLINGWERARRREAVKAERAATEDQERIRREIHDGIASSISGLRLKLSACSDLIHRHQNDLMGPLEEVESMAQGIHLEVRDQLFNLEPYLRGERGITEMLDKQAREWTRVTGTPTSPDSKGKEHQMSASAVWCLNRVTKQALHNVLEHAHASQVDLILEFLPESVQLMVKDDGRGFDAATTPEGNGIKNMRERAEELGGSFGLHSSPGAGATVVVQIPY